MCVCNLRFVDEIRAELIYIRDQCRSKEHKFTDSQRLTLAILDVVGAIGHGVNIEYPILRNEEDFWNKLD